MEAWLTGGRSNQNKWLLDDWAYDEAESTVTTPQLLLLGKGLFFLDGICLSICVA